MFKALGDPTRLEVVRLLSVAGDDLCACEIEAHFHLSQPTVSHHLRLLREAGLVVGERRGTWMHYTLAVSGLAAVRGFLDTLATTDAGQSN